MNLSIPLPLLLVLALAATARTAPSKAIPAQTQSGSPLSPLTVYAGSWIMTSAHPIAGSEKVTTLTNHCHQDAAFYTCEQVVNGKPFALLVFVADTQSGHFFTQEILANGRATGRVHLTIAGNHWTYQGSGTDESNKPIFYRTENFFSGPDRIHFEQYGSSDGKNWTKKNEGDEARTPTSASRH